MVGEGERATKVISGEHTKHFTGIVCPNITHFACQLFSYIDTKASLMFEPCKGIAGLRMFMKCAVRQLMLHALNIVMFLF